MSSATATPVRPRSPQATAARAHRVLRAALAVAELWASSAVALLECAALDRAIEDYQAVESGAITWEAYHPELSAEADPHGEALERLAGETALAVTTLLVAIAAVSGTEVADGIKFAAIEGGAGGQGQ